MRAGFSPSYFPRVLTVGQLLVLIHLMPVGQIACLSPETLDRRIPPPGVARSTSLVTQTLPGHLLQWHT